MKAFERHMRDWIINWLGRAPSDPLVGYSWLTERRHFAESLSGDRKIFFDKLTIPIVTDFASKTARALIELSKQTGQPIFVHCHMKADHAPVHGLTVKKFKS